jgi:hypothetical protein
MTQEVLKMALDYLESRGLAWNVQIALREALREHAMREVQRLGQEIEQEPEYAWPTVADYERDVGFQTNEAFRMAWGMARTTNKMLGHPSPPQRTWVGLTESERRLINFQWQDGNGTAPEIIDLVEAKLKEKNT